MSFKGTLIFNAPIAAFAMGSADRGHKLSAGAEAMSMGVGALVGGLLFGMPGAIVGGLLFDQGIAAKVGKGVQKLADFGRDQTRLKTGGN